MEDGEKAKQIIKTGSACKTNRQSLIKPGVFFPFLFHLGTVFMVNEMRVATKNY